MPTHHTVAWLIKAIFFVGTHCANEFLDIINHESLPLFNPMTYEQSLTTGSGNSSGSGNNAQSILL